MAINDGVNTLLQSSLDGVAIIIGLFAILIVFRLNGRLGGRINIALRYFIAGVLSNIVAIIWSLSFGHDYIWNGFAFDIHQNFMTLGMIFFIISTVQFSKLMRIG